MKGKTEMHAVLMGLLLLAAATTAPAPTCRVADGPLAGWTGTPAELSGVEASYQAQYARSDGAPHPRGAPVPSPLAGTVRCSGAEA
jgi:hypothetical protein